MISIIFNFKTKPSKNLEFMQSIGSVIVNLRKIKGCSGIDLQQDDSDKDQFTLQLNWQSRIFIKELLERKEYEILEGAIKVLCEELSIEIINGHKTIKTNMHTNRKTSIKNLIQSELKHNLSH